MCLYVCTWRRPWHATPVLLPGKSHQGRSLVGYSPWGRQESNMTEWLHFHFSLSCTGEGNGNRLQCSCLENPREGGAWWAAVYGVAQSRTRLTRLSSSSSSCLDLILFSHVWLLSLLSRVRLFATPWSVACQASLSMGIPRQEYQSGLPCPPPGDLPDPGIKPTVSPESSASPADSLLRSHPGSPWR